LSRHQTLKTFPLRFHITRLELNDRFGQDYGVTEREAFDTMLCMIEACASHLLSLILYLHNPDYKKSRWAFWRSTTSILSTRAQQIQEFKTSCSVADTRISRAAQLDVCIGLQNVALCTLLVTLETPKCLPLIPVLACIHKLVNLRRVQLSLDHDMELEMHEFRAICSTFCSLRHAQSTLNVDNQGAPIIQPRNTLHVASMRDLWPIELHRYLQQEWGCSDDVYGVPAHLLKALTDEEAQLVTHIQLEGDTYSMKGHKLTSLVHQIARCSQFQQLTVRNAARPLHKILKDITPVLHQIEHLEVYDLDDINLQPFIDAQPGKLGEITVFWSDCANKVRFAQQLTMLGVTSLSILSDKWSSPWNDEDAVRALIPALVCYDYSG